MKCIFQDILFNLGVSVSVSSMLTWFSSSFTGIENKLLDVCCLNRPFGTDFKLSLKKNKFSALESAILKIVFSHVKQKQLLSLSLNTSQFISIAITWT